MKKLLYFIVAAFLLTSCEKELSLEGAVPQKPLPDPKPEPADTIPRFQLTAFYSDIPIDFDETDAEVRSETNLWAYVLDYIKDDYHILHTDSTMEVIQNSIKMPGLEDPVLYRNYAVGSDNLGQFMFYLTADYKQTKYRLYEMDENHFIIGLKWKDGARVYSKFERIN